MSDSRYHERAARWDLDSEGLEPDRRPDPRGSDDPLAELARLIDEDPFADFNRKRQEAAAPRAEPLDPRSYRQEDVPAAAPAYHPSHEAAADPVELSASHDDPSHADAAYEALPYEEVPYDDASFEQAQGDYAADAGASGDTVSSYDQAAYPPQWDEHREPGFDPTPEPYEEPAAYAEPVQRPAGEGYDYAAPAVTVGGYGHDTYRDDGFDAAPGAPYPDDQTYSDADAYADSDSDETQRLYAELAAATQRVEPTFGEPPLIVRNEPPEWPSAKEPRTGGYDAAAALAASLSIDTPRAGAYADAAYPDDGYADGTSRGGAYPDEVTLQDGWDTAEDPAAAGYDDLYAETDPVYDDSGHIPPLEGDAEAAAPRRRGMLVAGALIGVVVIGGVAAAGYYLVAGGDTGAPPPVIRADRGPVKIQPPQSADSETQAEQPGKLVYDRVGGDQAAEERLVPREEPVADVGNRQIRVIDTNEGGDLRGTTGDGSDPAAADELPKRVRTVVVKPDGTIVGDVAPPQPAQPLQPAPLPGATAEPESTSTTPETTAEETEAPAVTTGADGGADGVPLPAPRPTDVPRSQGQSQVAPTPLAPTPAAPAPSAPSAPPATAQSSQPGAGFVPPSAPPAEQSRPAPLQPTAMASLPTASAPAASQQSSSQQAPAVAPTTGSFPAGAYVVQVAASRDEQDARSTAASIGQQYGGSLEGYAPVVERADLGDRGIYYRVGLGPLSSQGDASTLCARLKSAGLDCFVRRN